MDPRYDEAVRRARLGDPRAFRAVAEHIGPELVRYLTWFLHGDVHAAHDVAQDTLLRAWHVLATLNDGRHLRRWCYHVARCKAVTWLRRRHPRGRTVQSLDCMHRDDAQDLPPLAVVPEPLPPTDDLKDSLRRALRRLPPHYAAALNLHYVQGCTTRETARLLGVNRTAVKMRLHRARAFLRRAIHNDQLLQGTPHELLEGGTP